MASRRKSHRGIKLPAGGVRCLITNVIFIRIPRVDPFHRHISQQNVPGSVGIPVGRPSALGTDEYPVPDRQFPVEPPASTDTWLCHKIRKSAISVGRNVLLSRGVVRYDLPTPASSTSIARLERAVRRLKEEVIQECRFMRRDCCDPKGFGEHRDAMWQALSDLDKLNEEAKKYGPTSALKRELARRRVKGAR